MMDSTNAGAVPVTADRPIGLWAALVRSFRSRRNRARVARLEHLTDHELYDIGLTRLDLDAVMYESRFFEDPSVKLKNRAALRRGG